MGHALVQVRFARDNGLPEDVVINTFHFESAAGTLVTNLEAQAFAGRVSDFYLNTYAPSTVPVRTYISNVLANVGHEIRVYDMGLPKPRAPIYTQALAMTTGGSALPSEVAICLSYRAPLISGVPPARRRGRIYIGPLGTGTNVLGVTDISDVRPQPTMQNTLVDSALGALATPGTSGPWVVASQPDPLGPYTLSTITHLWVDNAFDTQRRRGAKPTSRVTRDVSGV
jgi:hypothetical protein